jgi:N-acetylglutamate synthase-like GNAT family acetyltransferase
MNDPRAQRHSLQLDLLRLYSQVHTRPWGVLLYNAENPGYYEANGARQIRTENPDSVIGQIVRFYQTRGFTPRVLVDEDTKPADLVKWLEAHGFESAQNEFRILTWQAHASGRPAAPVEVKITVATRQDLDALVAIQLEDDPWARPEWLHRRTRSLLSAKTIRYYIAWQEEIAVATAMLFQGNDAGLIEGVVTRPDYRRRGLASALIQKIQSETTKPLLLEVEDDAVERLYTRLGFEIAAEATESQCWLPAE